MPKSRKTPSILPWPRSTLAIDEKGKATLETTNGAKTQELVLPLSECHQPHPSEDVPDHCQLMFLSQPTLLENTRVRFANDLIHTYVGDILVCINPFKWDVKQAVSCAWLPLLVLLFARSAGDMYADVKRRHGHHCCS